MVDEQTPVNSSRGFFSKPVGKACAVAAGLIALYGVGKLNLDTKVDGMLESARQHVYDARHSDPKELDSSLSDAIANYQSADFAESYIGIMTKASDQIPADMVPEAVNALYANEIGREIMFYGTCKMLIESQGTCSEDLVKVLGQDDDGKMALAYTIATAVKSDSLTYMGHIEIAKLCYNQMSDEDKSKAERELVGLFRESTRMGVISTVWDSMSRDEHLQFVRKVLPQCTVELGETAFDGVSDAAENMKANMAQMYDDVQKKIQGENK